LDKLIRARNASVKAYDFFITVPFVLQVFN
jgi:hypothetical protein